jgi:hypothetical protein
MGGHGGVVDLMQDLLVVEDDGEEIEGVLRDGREGELDVH